MKKTVAFMITVATIFFIFGCGNPTTPPDGGKSDAEILELYKSEAKFRLIADRGAKVSESSLRTYAECGFNGYILTEDYVPFTDNAGAITSAYKGAIENAASVDLEVYVRNHYNDPDYFQNDDPDTVRTTAYGYNYTLPVRNLTNEFDQYANLSGFYMWDEPRLSQLDSILPLVSWYNANQTDKFFHINLFPSYAGPERIGSSLSEYINQYVEKVLSKVQGEKSLCLDNYPLLSSKADGNYIRLTYLEDLLTAANITRDYNASANKTSKATFGICIQAFKDSELRDIVCAADIEFQLNTGLALGCGLFEYFLYTSLGELQGIMESDAITQRGALYSWVKQANTNLSNLNMIMDYDWKGLITSSGTEKKENPDAFRKAAGQTISSLTGVKNYSGRFDSVCGLYEKEGKYAYMVANWMEPSSDGTNYIDMEFEGNVKKVAVFSDQEAKVVSVQDNKIQLKLSPGKGAFVIPV